MVALLKRMLIRFQVYLQQWTFVFFNAYHDVLCGECAQHCLSAVYPVWIRVAENIGCVAMKQANNYRFQEVEAFGQWRCLFRVDPFVFLMQWLNCYKAYTWSSEEESSWPCWFNISLHTTNRLRFHLWSEISHHRLHYADTDFSRQFVLMNNGLSLSANMRLWFGLNIS